LTAAVVLAATTGCIKGGYVIIPHPGQDTIHYPDFAEAGNPKVLGTANGGRNWRNSV